MATIHDIARLSGVSLATVSRVVNGTARVDPETERRVREAIRRVGYTPNTLARGLRQKDGRAVGLVVPEINHPAFSIIITHVERFSRQHGCNLLLGNTGSDPDTEAEILNDLLSRHVNGVIVLRVSNGGRTMTLLDDGDVPVSLIGGAAWDDPLPSVTTDNVRAGAMAADHIMQSGHTDILCLTGPNDTSVSLARLTGFTSRLEEGNIQLEENSVIEGDFSFQSGLAAGSRIYEMMKTRIITAVWAQNDPMAVGVMKSLLHRGVRIPEDVSVMGMDDVDIASLFVPGLTTIRQPFERMSELAVSYLLDPDRNRNHSIVLEPELVVRESVADISGIKHQKHV